MRAKIIERPVAVFRATKGVMDTSPFAEVEVGTEIECGESKLISGRQFTAVVLPDGQRGYIFGDTKVLQFKRVLLKAEKVPVHGEPDFESPVTTRLAKGSTVYLVETVERGSKKWNRVRAPGGVEGYIEAITPVVIVPNASKTVGRHYLKMAIRWLLAAAALALLGAAFGLRANGMCIMACVPFSQGVRFGFLAAWHLRTAQV